MSSSPTQDSQGGSGNDSGDSGVSGACEEALASVQADQDTVKERQDDLQEALSALGKTLDEAVTAVDKAAQNQTQAPSQPQTQTQTQTQTRVRTRTRAGPGTRVRAEA